MTNLVEHGSIELGRALALHFEKDVEPRTILDNVKTVSPKSLKFGSVVRSEPSVESLASLFLRPGFENDRRT
jgi:hypothetical protein